MMPAAARAGDSPLRRASSTNSALPLVPASGAATFRNTEANITGSRSRTRLRTSTAEKASWYKVV